MLALIIVNAVLLLLAAAILAGLIPARWFAYFMYLLHNTIGITTPTEKQVRLAILIWIAATLIILDGTLYLIRYAF